MKKFVSSVVVLFLVCAAGLVTASAAQAATTDFISTWDTRNTSSGSSDANSVALPLRIDGSYNFTVNWGDNSSSTITAYNDPAVTHAYATPGTYVITITGQITGFAFQDGGDKLKLTDISQWGSLKLGNSEGYFQGAANFNSSATDAPVLSGTTTLKNAFQGATSFNGALDNWDVSGVTILESAFENATSFNRPLNSWDVSNVTEMRSVFYEASAFNQPLSNWNVSKVWHFGIMFYGASSFNQSLATWDIATGGITAGLETQLDEMLLYTALSSENYGRTLVGWSQLANINVMHLNGAGDHAPNSFQTNAMYSSDAPVLAARAHLVANGWNIADGGPAREDVINILGDGLSPMVLSPDGVTLALSSWNTREVFLIDTTTQVVRPVLVGQVSSDQPGGLAFSPDGDTLYAVVYGKSVEVINVANGNVIDRLVADSGHATAFDEVWSLSITRDGKTLMLGRFGLGGIVYFDIDNEVVTNVFSRLKTDASSESATWTPLGIVNSQFLSHDGLTVYMLGYNGAIDAFSATSNPAQQQRLDSSSWLLTSGGVDVPNTSVDVGSSCLSPDGATVYIPAGYDHDTVYKVDLSSGNVLQEGIYRTPNGQFYGQWECVVSPDGKSLYVTQPNDHEPSIVVEYSTDDLSATPIIHEIPFSTGFDFGYTFSITVVGCDAYVSGFYQQIGIMRNIGCDPDVPDNNQQAETASHQLANTGAPALQSATLGISILSMSAVVVGLIGVAIANRARRQN